MPTQIPSTGPAGGGPFAQRVGERREAAGRALEMADAGDHRERRLAHGGRHRVEISGAAPARSSAAHTLRRFPAP